MNTTLSSQQITKQSGSNLALSFVSLDQDKKRAMTIFYAYCRIADDIVDDKNKSRQQKLDDIDFWRQEVRACYEQRPSSPLGQELQEIIRRYQIPQQPLLDLLDGVAMDVDKSRYAHFGELELYCYRVASAVGLVSIEIFQYSDPRAKEYAVALGMAFQLTNILRDVRFDFEKYGRIYLPQDEMAAYGVSEEILFNQQPHHGRDSLLRMQAFRTEHYFQKAARLFPHADRKNFQASELMTEVYYRLLQRLRANQCRLPAQPLRLNKLQKLAAVRHASRHGATINQSHLRPPQKIAVWGGGYAGLSAAFHLAMQGHQVELFEIKSYLGGRAHSFKDTRSGLTLDNSQHALFGCYYSCLAMLDTLGAKHKLIQQDGIAVPYLSRDGSRAILKAGKGPAPFHMLSGLWGFKALGIGDRLEILAFGLRLRFGGQAHANETASQWLRRLGQSQNAIRCLWEPFCLAALNQPIETAHAGILERTIRLCLLGSRADSSIYRNSVGLSELFSPELDRFLAAVGGKIHVNCGVKEVSFANEQICGFKTTRDESITADCYVSALPAPALRALLPPESPLAQQLGLLKSAPILSVHLLTDCPILTTEPFAALLDSPIQWIFKGSAADGAYLYSLVISAAQKFVDMPQQALQDLLWTELQHYFPATKNGKILHQIIYKSRDATFAAIPGVEQLRPQPATPWPNLFLAGDWIQTGLPATIESATLSGKWAAERVSVLN